MDNKTTGLLVEYLALCAAKQRVREKLIPLLSLDDLIRSGLFTEAVIKYRDTVNCSLKQAHETMKERQVCLNG